MYAPPHSRPSATNVSRKTDTFGFRNTHFVASLRIAQPKSSLCCLSSWGIWQRWHDVQQGS